MTFISDCLVVAKSGSRVTYFGTSGPLFGHDVDDIPTFRMITSQFHVLGSISQAEIARAFGVPKISVLRAVKLYREKGPAGFYAERRTRGSAVLTPRVLAEAQALLDGQKEVAEVADQLGLKRNTLAKAVGDGRLQTSPTIKGPRST